MKCYYPVTTLLVCVSAVLAIIGWSNVSDQSHTVAAASPASAPATAPADKWALHYYKQVSIFEKQNREARNIVIVGSSHVEGFDAAKLLPGRRIVNRGIAADRIGIDDRGILHRLDSSVFDCNPGFIILENGVNDLGELKRHGTPSMEEIDACFRKVVGKIRKRLPEVPLLIVNLFPTRDKYADLTPLIVEFNRRLKQIAADNGCSYMDAYTPLADDQDLLLEKYSRDGLHLNAAGYQLWADMIEKTLPPRE